MIEYDKRGVDTMKKLLPLALIGAAVGATALLMNKNNKKHLEKTIATLDEISQKATETVNKFAEEVIETIDNSL